HAVVGAPRQVLAGRVDHGEVDGHLGARVLEGLGGTRHLDAGRLDAELPEVDADVVRVDRRDELQLRVVDDGTAHGRAHASGGAEDADLDHRVTVPTGPTTASVRRPHPSTRSTTRDPSSGVPASM